MLYAAIASAVALGFGTPAPMPSQQDPNATRLPGVEVTGRPTPAAVRDFVDRVAAPAMGRGLGRWMGQVCPGVVNMETMAAQAVVDRISNVAADLNIKTGAPGCAPNIIVIVTPDAQGVAQAFAAQHPKIFRQNVTGLDRGTAAFREFRTGDQPVRWWSLSIPVDSMTGQRAVRIPGDPTGMIVDAGIAAALGCNPDDCIIGAAPIIYANAPSRLRTQIVDNLFKTIIFVDVDKIGEVNTRQLGDYLAFVSLAQINGQAETSNFDTILNLFTGGGQKGLTAWDRSYLSAIYASRPERISLGAQADAVASIMTRDQLAERRAR